MKLYYKNMIKDKEGNKIVLDIQVYDLNLKLINIYGPNKDDISFYNSLNQNFNDNEQDYILWCGDFNMTLNPELDSHNYSNINNPNSCCVTLDIIKDHSLFDFHLDTRRYTWRRYKPIKQARLDWNKLEVSRESELLSDMEKLENEDNMNCWKLGKRK